MIRNVLSIKAFATGIIFILISVPILFSCEQAKSSNIAGNEGKNVRNMINLNFDQKIAFYMKLGHMPSLAALIIKNNSIAWSNAYGYADRERHIKATLDTIYMIGSTSKSICAVAVMQLLESCQITSLDDDVNSYLDFSLRNPYYPMDNITFRMLLGHHSSLISDDVPLFIMFSLLGYARAWLKEFLVPGGQFYNPNIWLDASPGEKECYSSLNFEILAYLVERISQQPYEQYVENHIFRPLNMSSTSYFLSDLNLSYLAVPYVWMAGRYVRLPYYQDRNAGAGGVKSTVLDLSHYLIIHMNGGAYNGVRILNNTSINEIHRRQYNSSASDYYYGLGWFTYIESDQVLYGGHGGMVAGGRTVMRMRYEDNVGVIFCYNQYNFLINNKEYKPIRIFINLYKKIELFAFNEVLQLLYEKTDTL
jgi:CubicO group peptidase (beta-lactamase class C family)